MSERAGNAEIGNALVTKFTFDKTVHRNASVWLVKSLMLGSQAAGFLNGEIIPPTEDDGPWSVVQRFSKPSDATAWKQSERRTQFLAELHSVHADGGFRATDVDQVVQTSTVTTAIMTQVKPGMEPAYREWEEKVQAAQASFPGFKGSYVQPDTGDAGVWVSLLRFDSPESLDRWFNSAERHALLQQAEKIVASTEIQRVTGSFPGWVPVDPNTGKGPPNWKTFLLVLLGLYPIVSLEIRFLMPLISQMPAAAANLFSLCISVAATTWLTMPLFIKWFAAWLFPPKAKRANEVKWIAIIASIFATELAMLWNLFR